MSNLFKEKSKILFVVLAFFSAFFFGIVSLFMANIVGEKYEYLVSLPLAFGICIFFILNRKLFLLVVVLTRASLDSPLDAIKFGTFGLGAVLNALIILIALLMYLEQRTLIDSNSKKIVNAWLVFLFLAFISIFYSPSILASIKGFLSLLSYASMFYLGLSYVKKESDFGKWISIVVYSSIVPVIWGIISKIFGTSGLRFNIIEGYRLQGTFNHPNSFAFYLVLIITLCFYLYKTKSNYISATLIKVLPIYILTLLGLLLMTKTRAAWAACGLFFLLYGLIFERKFLIVLFSASLLALLLPDVQDRLIDLQQGGNWGSTGYERLNSYAWRVKYWTDAISWMSVSHYIQGYGLRSFMHFSTSFGMGNAHHLQTLEINAHSVYVLLFFELGLLGVFAFLYLIYTKLQALFRIYQYEKLLAFTVFVMLVEFLFECYSDNMLDYLNFDWYLWFVVGLTISYSTILKSKQKHRMLSLN